jgi:hypothetical protein
MKALTTAAVLVATTLALLAGRAAAARIPEPRPPSTVSASRLVDRGRILCTATVEPSVQVGDAVRVHFAFQNVARRSIKVVLDWGLSLTAADGTTYDPSVPLMGLPRPPPFPIKFVRGATRTGRIDVPVRWSGPLRINPECDGARLPGLRVEVTSPGPPPDADTAVTDVVAASLHLLDHCRPHTSGVAVSGQIEPPSGSAPPMSAACTVSIEPEGTFSVAQVLVLIPPGLTGVTVLQPYELFGPPFVPFGPPPAFPPPYEAIAWELVVTRDGALPVAAVTADASNTSTQMYPAWVWDGTTSQVAEASCGGQAFAWGGTYPWVEFISACSSP